MKESTKKQIIKLIELDNITDPTDEKIEGIADRFPGEYADGETEQGYIDFQVQIADLVKERALKTLAKKYDAEIYGEDYDETGTGQLMKTFSPDDYDDTLVLDEELGGYVDHTTEEYSKYVAGELEYHPSQLVVCSPDHIIESIVDFENGSPVSASYCYTKGYTASTSIDDDVDGVIDFWCEG